MGKKEQQNQGGQFGSFWSSILKEKTSLGLFVLLRLFIGYSFLMAGWGKYRSDWLNPSPAVEPLAATLQKFIASPGGIPDWYHSIITNVVIPNAHLFGILICLGEILVGAFLIIGLCTRLAGLMGAFLCLNYLFATAHITIAFKLENEAFVLSCLLIMLAGAGRAWGADWFLRRAFPKIPLW